MEGSINAQKWSPRPDQIHVDGCASPYGYWPRALAWVRKVMVKIMRNFLWTGTDPVQRGRCAVAWNSIQRPLYLGGLCIPDLRVMGLVLRLRWLWLQHCDDSRPWAELPVVMDNVSKAFFRASIVCLVGNGERTLFWEEPWLGGLNIADWAPNLVVAVSARCHRSRMVADALANNAWMRDISGALSILVLVQYLQLRERLVDVQLDLATADKTLWRWTSSSLYSSSSAYAIFFHGQTALAGAKEVWRIKAPHSTSSSFG
jgi:hypothetical protein